MGCIFLICSASRICSFCLLFCCSNIVVFGKRCFKQGRKPVIVNISVSKGIWRICIFVFPIRLKVTGVLNSLEELCITHEWQPLILYESAQLRAVEEYIYIVTNRLTVSLYPYSSVLLDTGVCVCEYVWVLSYKNYCFLICMYSPRQSSMSRMWHSGRI